VNSRHKWGILLVEHHPFLRDMLRHLLRAKLKTFELLGEAEDAVHAIEVALELTPEVVVIDVLLPDINGLQATRLIKRLLPDARIVLLVEDTRDYERAAEESGAAACVSKAVISEELPVVLNRLMGEGGTG
jgi:DNA-binding NarL/FixJ family response regulator